MSRSGLKRHRKRLITCLENARHCVLYSIHIGLQKAPQVRAERCKSGNRGGHSSLYFHTFAFAQCHNSNLRQAEDLYSLLFQTYEALGTLCYELLVYWHIFLKKKIEPSEITILSVCLFKCLPSV
jgi:hypothetical protein